MSGFLIIIAGAMIHIVIMAKKTAGFQIQTLSDFLPYILYILGILVAAFGYYYTPPHRKLVAEE